MTVRAVWSCLVLAILCGIGNAGQSQPQARPFLDLESQTGVELCAPTPQNRLTSLSNSTLFLDAPKARCRIWDRAFPEVTLWASRSKIDHLDLPVVVAIRNGDPTASMRRRMFVRVVGGPGASVAPNENYALTLSFLRLGDVLVTPAYPGTRHGTNYPEENYSPSSEHIAQWLRNLRQHNPDADIVLVGESLGGQIALEANRRAGSSHADQIVLLSPLAYSSSDASQNFTRRRGSEYRDDNKLSVRLLRSHANGTTSSSWQQVFSTDLFKTFFPESERGVDIGQRLRANSQIPILLIYGTLDWRAGVAVIEGLPPQKNLHVVKFVGMPHEIGEQYRPAVTAAIMDFLD